MNTEERIKKQKELVEEIGRHFDKEGLQPIAGRILGLLMVMDKEKFTFDEITEELQISKSSASIALRNLELRDNIEYITLPGDRKRYFQIKRQNAFQILEEMEKKLSGSISMFNYIISLKADQNSPNSVFLSELIRTMEIFLKYMDKAKNKYNNNKN